MTSRKITTTAAIIIAAVVLSGLLGFYFATITVAHASAGSQADASSQAKSSTVNLDIIPDWGGAGYDAFVLAGNINSTAPTPATSTAGPGPNNNNVTVSADSPVTFVITTIDTAVLQNFSGTVSVPFVIYNDTDSGQVAVQYNQGQAISNIAIGHTFTITELGMNIPIPPDTVVTFTYTFTKPGVYVYFCETPCGPGMGLVGYMNGYIIVK